MSAPAPTPDTPPHRYDARLAGEIEVAWQQRWEDEGTFHAPNPVGELSDAAVDVEGLPKKFVMDMFPYPSGAGLHVGHPLGYIGTDVYARYYRMTGHNVMHTMGYDSFGLPAELYAVQTGQHPRATTEANIAIMRRQLRRLGLGHDSRRSVSTIDEGFYRWTQWIFLQIFESWYDTDADRARPITELIAELDAGPASPARAPTPPTARGASCRPPRSAWSSTTTAWPTSARRRSTGARRWAPCCPTRRSRPTGAASGATTPCSAARCGSGCCASPRTPTAWSATSTPSTGPSPSG